MKKDVTELKKMFLEILKNPSLRKMLQILQQNLYKEIML